MLYSFARVHFFSFFFLFSFFSATFVGAISLEPLLAETPNWVCCLVLQSNFALLLTIQFTSLVFFFSATILSGVEFSIFGGSLLGHIQGDREPVSFIFALHLSALNNLTGPSAGPLVRITYSIPFHSLTSWRHGVALAMVLCICMFATNLTAKRRH